MTPQFTPGPYSFRRDTDGCDECWDIVASFAESPLASIPFWSDEDGQSSPEAKANARLFTAAPELYDAANAPDVDAAHDALSDLLENPDASNDDIREAAIDLCSVLVRHHEIRMAALVKTERNLP